MTTALYRRSLGIWLLSFVAYKLILIGVAIAASMFAGCHGAAMGCLGAFFIGYFFVNPAISVGLTFWLGCILLPRATNAGLGRGWIALAGLWLIATMKLTTLAGVSASGPPGLWSMVPAIPFPTQLLLGLGALLALIDTCQTKQDEQLRLSWLIAAAAAGHATAILWSDVLSAILVVPIVGKMVWLVLSPLYSVGSGFGAVLSFGLSPLVLLRVELGIFACAMAYIAFRSRGQRNPIEDVDTVFTQSATSTGIGQRATGGAGRVRASFGKRAPG